MKPEEKNPKRVEELNEEELGDVTGGLQGNTLQYQPGMGLGANTLQYQPGMGMGATTLQYQPGVNDPFAQTLGSGGAAQPGAPSKGVKRNPGGQAHSL